MQQESLEYFESPDLAWGAHPDPAELAALEDIQREGWFDMDEPVITSLLELVEAVSSVSDTEAEVVATVAHMLESGSVALLTGESLISLPLH
ncbi:MAG: hypothetical protein ABGX04_05100 [Myxococcales bacterium]|nr:hypothetical protein [Myxococcales bacterium]HIL80232.1 hypothetical protein [Myxococcales bacterium]